MPPFLLLSVGQATWGQATSWLARCSPARDLGGFQLCTLLRSKKNTFTFTEDGFTHNHVYNAPVSVCDDKGRRFCEVIGIKRAP